DVEVHSVGPAALLVVSEDSYVGQPQTGIGSAERHGVGQRLKCCPVVGNLKIRAGNAIARAITQSRSRVGKECVHAQAAAIGTQCPGGGGGNRGTTRIIGAARRQIEVHGVG